MTAFAAGCGGAGADEHGVIAQVGVAHAVGVGFEIGQLFVGVAGGVAGEHKAGGLGNEGVDVIGVEVGEPDGQPVGVTLAENGCERGGEIVQVLAGVVDVHDRGGFGRDRGGPVPDPGGAVAEHHQLADVIGAAAASFGV